MSEKLGHNLPLRRGATSDFHAGRPDQKATSSGCGRSGGGVVSEACFWSDTTRQKFWSLTHLSVSVADGLCEGAPSLSIFHLHWCIVGQQQVGALCMEDRRVCRLKNIKKTQPKFHKHQNRSPTKHQYVESNTAVCWLLNAQSYSYSWKSKSLLCPTAQQYWAYRAVNVYILKKIPDLKPKVIS